LISRKNHEKGKFLVVLGLHVLLVQVKREKDKREVKRERKTKEGNIRFNF